MIIIEDIIGIDFRSKGSMSIINRVLKYPGQMRVESSQASEFVLAKYENKNKSKSLRKQIMIYPSSSHCTTEKY